MKTFLALLMFLLFACDSEAGKMYSANYCECVTKRLDSGVGYPIKVCNTDSIAAFKKKSISGKDLVELMKQNPCDKVD